MAEVEESLIALGLIETRGMVGAIEPDEPIRHREVLVADQVPCLR